MATKKNVEKQDWSKTKNCYCFSDRCMTCSAFVTRKDHISKMETVCIHGRYTKPKSKFKMWLDHVFNRAPY